MKIQRTYGNRPLTREETAIVLLDRTRSLITEAMDTALQMADMAANPAASKQLKVMFMELRRNCRDFALDVVGVTEEKYYTEVESKHDKESKRETACSNEGPWSKSCLRSYLAAGDGLAVLSDWAALLDLEQSHALLLLANWWLVHGDEKYEGWFCFPDSAREKICRAISKRTWTRVFLKLRSLKILKFCMGRELGFTQAHRRWFFVDWTLLLSLVDFEKRRAGIEGRGPASSTKNSSNQGWVYFVQSGKNGPIKIGWSKEPRRRVRDLQNSTPALLSLVGLIKGTMVDEQNLHFEFGDL